MKYIYIPLNCSKCGRFVGKDGFHDYDPETREVGYPLCKRCLSKKQQITQQSQPNKAEHQRYKQKKEGKD